MPDPVCSPVSQVVSLNGVLPGFVYQQIYDYCRDAEHGVLLEFDQIRPETQVMIAGLIRDRLDDPMSTMRLDRRARLFDPNASVGTGLPLPIPIGQLKLPGSMTLTIWSKNFSDPSKYTGASLQYTLWNF